MSEPRGPPGYLGVDTVHLDDVKGDALRSPLHRLQAEIAKDKSYPIEQSQTADASRAKDVRDVANDLRKVTSPKAMGVDALRDAASSFEKWDPMKGAQSGPKPAPKATETPASPPATPAPEKGPNTQALAEAQAARRAAQAEARAAKKAAAEAPAAPAKPAKKAPAKAPAKAPTKTAPKTAAKPAPKPKKKPDA